MPPFLSVLIPNYNGAALLEENLPFTFRALENCGCSWELLVADDASTDTSCRFLEENYPEIRLIKAEKNLGFSGNCNRGAAFCRGEWMLLLNSDVKLDPDYLKTLLPFTGEKGIFSLGGSIFPDGPGSIMDGGKFPAWKGSMLQTTLNFLPVSGTGNAFPSLFLSGAASLMHCASFRELGGFQELFNPYYFEDAEIAIHAWRRGWKSLFIPEARCFHRISSTIAASARKQAVQRVARRNKLLLHEIHLGGWRRLFWKFTLLIYYPWSWVFPASVKGLAFSDYLKRRSEAQGLRKKTESLPGIRSLEEVVSDIRYLLRGSVDRLF